MFVFQSALQTLKKYAEFKGRASRQEFWCFVVFVMVVNALFGPDPYGSDVGEVFA